MSRISSVYGSYDTKSQKPLKLSSGELSYLEEGWLFFSVDLHVEQHKSPQIQQPIQANKTLSIFMNFYN